MVLRMEGIVKRFAGVMALDGVGFELERGEVHALVGENGAGKSTLIKIMTGAYRRDAGEMYLEGQPVSFNTPADAQTAGIWPPLCCLSRPQLIWRETRYGPPCR
jgi:galactofuranose transport system ATP-binding protein